MGAAPAAAAGLRLLPAGAQLPSNVLGKFCASEFISFPCTGSRWHRAPCPLVVNTAGSLPALETLWPGVQFSSAAVLGVSVLVSFTSHLFGGCRGDPVAGAALRSRGPGPHSPPGTVARSRSCAWCRRCCWQRDVRHKWGFSGTQGEQGTGSAQCWLVQPRLLLFEQEIRNLERKSQPQGGFGRYPAELGFGTQGPEPLCVPFPQRDLLAVPTLLGHCHL